MLSKHPESCRYPHGHSRIVEIVVSAPQLDKNDMVLDFKALKRALEPAVHMFDHSMAINSADPMADALLATHPQGVVIFEETDPTTEVMARELYEMIKEILDLGWQSGSYKIPAGTVHLERVRVGETQNTWAEYGD